MATNTRGSISVGVAPPEVGMPSTTNTTRFTSRPALPTAAMIVCAHTPTATMTRFENQNMCHGSYPVTPMMSATHRTSPETSGAVISVTTHLRASVWSRPNGATWTWSATGPISSGMKPRRASRRAEMIIAPVNPARITTSA